MKIKLSKTGFTLIELLIVVAIISILTEIAITNYLQAQIRSKVANVKVALAVTATALEAYDVDNNDYPWDFVGATGSGGNNYWVPNSLTTPVAYITTIPLDILSLHPHRSHGVGLGRISWNCYLEPEDFTWYVNTGQNNGNAPDIAINSRQNSPVNIKYALFSVGPAASLAISMENAGSLLGDTYGDWYNASDNESYPIPQPYRYWYDPTNGTVSLGYIVREQGGTNLP